MSVDGGTTYECVGKSKVLNYGGHLIGGGYAYDTYNVDDTVGFTLTPFNASTPPATPTREAMYQYTQWGYNTNKAEWVSIGGHTAAGLTTTVLPVIRHIAGESPKTWEDGDLVFTSNPYQLPLTAIARGGGTGATQAIFKLVPMSAFNVGDLTDVAGITWTYAHVWGTPLPVGSLSIGSVAGMTDMYYSGYDIDIRWWNAAMEPRGAGYYTPFLSIPGLSTASYIPPAILRIYTHAGVTPIREIAGVTPPYIYTWADNQADHGPGGGNDFNVSVAQTAGVSVGGVLLTSEWRDFTIYRH